MKADLSLHLPAVVAMGGLLALAVLALSAEAAEPAPGAGAPGVIRGEWPSFLGPNYAFAGPADFKLVDDVSKARVVWDSEERGIGFGKAYSGAMRGGFAKGSGLGPSGAASPILAGGLVVQSYFLPRGPVWSADAEKGLGANFAECKSFTYVAADDVVIAIDAATGKTRWKAVFEDKGINYAPGKRGEWNVTPCAADGKVFAFGTTGRLYCLELASGKVLWESNIGPVHEQLEQAKKQGLEQRQMVRPAGRPYGMLVALDGMLLAPDWAGGLLGVEAATGKTLWRATQPGGVTSGFNCPAPVQLGGKSFVACVNGNGDLRLIDHKTGQILWSHALGSLHLTQPVFGKELLLVMDANTQKKRNEADTRAQFGVLAGYRLDEKGATRVWQLDGAKYPTELWLDGGPARKIVTRRDGVIYHAAWWGSQSKLAIVRESDGKVLSDFDCQHYWVIYLWGDRFYFLTDIQHGSHGPWRAYTTDPEKPEKLSEAILPKPGPRVCGYEVPLYEIFADGFMFCREWGGVRCYDLRRAP
jgi:outer membrane protein assembly factor BamB